MASKVYRLVKEDWTNVGLAMGYQHTSEIFSKLFYNKDDAKAYAEKDNGEPIEWDKDGKTLHSGDLRTHAYIIRRVKIN